MTTIKTIAKKANVSIGTVDRVIHKRGKVAPETELRIKRILKELNYRPNIFARTLKLQKKYLFGILMPKIWQDTGYWAVTVQGMEKAKSDLHGQNVDVVYYHYDKYSEKSFCKEFCRILESDLDGLLIAPLASQSHVKSILKIPSKLPYVFLDSNIPNSKNISYIGQNAFQSGVVAAKLMDILCKGYGTVIIFRMLPNDYHINRRVEGFISYFRSKAFFNLFTYDLNGNENQKILKKVMDRIIIKHKDIQGLFVTNVYSHKIAKQIIARELKNHIYIIGYDLVDENIYYMKQGIIDFLLSQRPEVQGYEGIYALYNQVVLKKTVEKEILMPVDIVTKENIDYYQSSASDLMT
jgi:LacI family transcriptional regulator